MFPLFQKELPTNADELTMALETSLRRLLLSSQKVVSIRARDYPKVDEIVINLNDAEIHHRPARLSPATGETTPFMTVNRLSLTGRQISFGLASLGLNITAQDVVFHQGRDDNGDVILLPYRIANGQVAI